MQRYFQISCHALIVSAFISLALTGRLDGLSILLFGIGVIISAHRALKGLPPLLSSRGAFLLSCGYILFFAFDTLFVSRSFIPATIHLVLFLELAKLFQDKTDRDYLYLIILSFLMILAASSLTIDMSFVATLFLFLVALVSTLMSFDMYRSERKAAAQVQNIAAPLGGMSVWATVWIVIVGVALFFVIPRVGTGYFSRAATPSLLISGFTESVQLGDIGQVKLSQAVVMRVRQMSGTKFAVLKWRGITLDKFNGNTWYRTGSRRFTLRPSVNDQYWIRPLENTGDLVRYQILLEPLATTTLFGPHRVRAISGRVQGGLEQGEADDSVYMRFQSLRRVQYNVLSEVPDRTRFLSMPGEMEQVPVEIRDNYLQLPGNLDPRISGLAKEITARGESMIEKASHVEAFLKRNYGYSLNLTWTPGPQPLSTFLFEAKNGHCEYFASSMAILLRAAGIPTRIVNGFLMGEYNPVGDDYIVRQSDAHSWVEVYVPGRGWLEFDPTPPDPNPREMTLAVQFSHYIDAMELFWNSYILIYDTSSQVQLFRSAQDRVQSIQNEVRDKSDAWVARGQILSDRFMAMIRQRVETAWFWMMVAVFVLAGYAFKHRRSIKTRIQVWRVRTGRGEIEGAVVEELFYQAARLAERRTDRRHPAQTWREWILRLPDPERRSILARALEVFEKSKYGRMPISNAEFTILEETIRELKT